MPTADLTTSTPPVPSHGTRARRVVAALIVATALAGSRSLAGAQPGTPSRPQPVGQAGGATEDDILRCWWRTSASAITVGEPFTLVLTCAVLQTESTTAVVDRARLDPRAIELAPFEVLAGKTAADTVAGDRLFFQYEYTLRFVNEAFFNQDVALPPLAVNYRIQTRSGRPAAGAPDGGTQGMERRFAMPHHALRVASLVPADATDIRDATTITFTDLDAAASRGRLIATSGLVFLGLAAVVALVGLARVVGARVRTPGLQSGLRSEFAMLRGAAQALAAVRGRRDAGGWTAEEAAAALAMTRVVAECAVDRQPSQRLVGRDQPVPSGALRLTRWWRPHPAVIVSGSLTPKGLASRCKAGDQSAAGARLEALRDALTTFTRATYTEGAPLEDARLDEPALDAALSSVERIARRLAIERTWLVQRLTLRAWRMAAATRAVA